MWSYSKYLTLLTTFFIFGLLNPKVNFMTNKSLQLSIKINVNDIESVLGNFLEGVSVKPTLGRVIKKIKVEVPDVVSKKIAQIITNEIHFDVIENQLENIYSLKFDVRED